MADGVSYPLQVFLYNRLNGAITLEGEDDPIPVYDHIRGDVTGTYIQIGTATDYDRSGVHTDEVGYHLEIYVWDFPQGDFGGFAKILQICDKIRGLLHRYEGEIANSDGRIIDVTNPTTERERMMDRTDDKKVISRAIMIFNFYVIID